MKHWVALSVATVALTSCGLEGEDYLLEEVRSPDGRLVARLWCEHLCDVAGRSVITISEAERRVDISPATDDWPPLGSGTVPPDDVALVVSEANENGQTTELAWTAADALQITKDCPHDGNYQLAQQTRFRSVRVTVLARMTSDACSNRPALVQ